MDRLCIVTHLKKEIDCGGMREQSRPVADLNPRYTEEQRLSRNDTTALRGREWMEARLKLLLDNLGESFLES